MTYKKTVVATFIFFLVFIFSPIKTDAQSFDVVQAAKELGTDVGAWHIANMAIKKITASTVNWINSGFQGNPTFVTDPGRFFLDVGNTELSKFLSETNLSTLCTPFKASIRLALVKNRLSETDGNIYSCTLDKIKGNYDAFMGDFDQGGWDGWYEITQNQQNNPYGAYLDAQSKLNIKIGNEKKKYEDQLNWGQGFLSHEKCSVLEYTDQNGRKVCNGTKRTITPGSAIEEQLNNALGAGNKRLEIADELNEIIGGLFNQFLGKVLGGSGLIGLTENNETGRLYDEQEPTEVDWRENYDGTPPSTGDLTTEACAAARDACAPSVTNVYYPPPVIDPYCVPDGFGNCI